MEKFLIRDKHLGCATLLTIAVLHGIGMGYVLFNFYFTKMLSLSLRLKEAKNTTRF
jgi:hypothetical protein